MAGTGLTRDQSRKRPSAAAVATALGLAAMVAAGVALWAAEGGSVFLANAFAAVMTCF
ncbi:hypothetical protein JOD31_001264 [Methylopila capsulata]|uniref:Uncharacterized protein n=1 Tax=Methylopila capsulata TaxID=61654 RepID=A0A9W6IR18_9HYPH|nr:hypothetical protein [Methylopila capsulata]MBM7851039.1 hypothetical protein [Methylopila capsulata]GLK54097.1 hypothetical protein GCM10008170_01160 [Methylopila capsulata]